MSRRGSIFLGVGLLILGLILGCVAGGFALRLFARRSPVSAAVGRFGPSMFGRQRVAPRVAPFNAQPATPGGVPFYGPRGGFGGGPSFGQGRGFGRTPSFGQGRGFGRTPTFGQRRGFGRTPSFGQRRGFGRTPFNRRAPARRVPFTAAFANGASVTAVESNSPADKAGLKTADVITTVAGAKIDQSHSFTSLLQSHKPGDKIDLGITRGGQSMTISVTLGAAPQNSNTAYLGIQYGPAPGPTQQVPRSR